MPSSIKKSQENDEYAEDFDHLSDIEPEKDLFSHEKHKSQSLFLKDLAFDSKSLENHNNNLEKSIEKNLSKNFLKIKEKNPRKKKISFKKEDKFSNESCSIFRISLKIF